MEALIMVFPRESYTNIFIMIHASTKKIRESDLSLLNLIQKATKGNQLGPFFNRGGGEIDCNSNELISRAIIMTFKNA